MDIRLYDNTGVYDWSGSSETLKSSPLSSGGTSDNETIAGKVVKFLLTTRGSDLIDPEYGSTLTSYTQIARNALPRMQMDLLDDISRCQRYIQTSEKAIQTGQEKLASIRLRELRHNPDIDPTRVDIFLEITTTRGNRSFLAIPNKA